MFGLAGGTSEFGLASFSGKRLDFQIQIVEFKVKALVKSFFWCLFTQVNMSMNLSTTFAKKINN